MRTLKTCYHCHYFLLENVHSIQLSTAVSKQLLLDVVCIVRTHDEKASISALQLVVVAKLLLLCCNCCTKVNLDDEVEVVAAFGVVTIEFMIF